MRTPVIPLFQREPWDIKIVDVHFIFENQKSHDY